ncbi:MAG: nucleotidyltransferase domain-containing protein, partial [Candidatus Micrarchaeota archaeon]
MPQNHMPGQERVEGFLAEWSASVSHRFPNDIDFILLFGSAARGEFHRGHSDVDLIIQTRNDAAIPAVDSFALKEFWRLDRKWGTGLREFCSIGRPRDAFDSVVKAIEASVRLYKPFEVIGPDTVDWKNGRGVRPDLLWEGELLGSQLSLFYKIKKEGKVLYGRDVLSGLHPHRSWWEKFKMLIIPQHLAFVGLFVSPLLPAKGVAYCCKSVLWAMEGALIARRRFALERQKQPGLLKHEFANLLPQTAVFNWNRFLADMGVRA